MNQIYKEHFLDDIPDLLKLDNEFNKIKIIVKTLAGKKTEVEINENGTILNMK